MHACAVRCALRVQRSLLCAKLAARPLLPLLLTSVLDVFAHHAHPACLEVSHRAHGTARHGGTQGAQTGRRAHTVCVCLDGMSTHTLGLGLPGWASACGPVGLGGSPPLPSPAMLQPMSMPHEVHASRGAHPYNRPPLASGSRLV